LTTTTRTMEARPSRSPRRPLPRPSRRL
jgi:hypothetical protein